MSIAEYNAVFKFLLADKALNLTSAERAEPTDSWIHGIYYEIPPKANVLRHIDAGGPKPARNARAVLMMGGAKPKAKVMEVIVGPLPKPTSWKQVPVSSTKAAQDDFNARPYSQPDSAGMEPLIDTTVALKAVTSTLYGGYYLAEGCLEANRCLNPSFGTVGAATPAIKRGVVVWFFRPVQAAADGTYMHPVSLQMLLDCTGQDISKWRVAKIWIGGIVFDSAAAVLKDWSNSSSALRRLGPYVFGTPQEQVYSGYRKRPGQQRGAAQPLGPQPHEPYGRRFTITEGNRVSWLGWQLYAGNLPTSGPRFFDIRFKGQRIAYELALNEAQAAYGGDDPLQQNTIYLDSHWGIGSSLRELVHGMDCPLNAAYMDAAAVYKGAAQVLRKRNAICVFEHDPNVPALRHYSYSFRFYGGVRNSQLIIRSVSEVFNYDYIHDVILNIDGTLETRVQTSGYIQATAYTPGSINARYGHPVFYNISGTIHSHLLAWKVDLDIAGGKNSVQMHRIGVKQSTNWAGAKVMHHKVDTVLAETENDTAVLMDNSKPAIIAVVAEGSRNKWGAPRGYKVQVNRVAHQLLPLSFPWVQGLDFAKWQFVATKQKDIEYSSSSIHNQADMSNPVLRLSDYVDGEPARNTDLVVWVSSGLFHLPHAEDAPSTPTTGNHIGFSLAPCNWGDENAATDMVDMVLMSDGQRTVPKVQAFAAATDRCVPVYEYVPFSYVWDVA